MNSSKDQIEAIASVINNTRENLKPLSINFIFWGCLVIVMSLFNYAFPSLIASTQHSATLFWTVLPLIGMILTIYYNIKYRNKTGYETYLNRVVKIIWGVFNLSWIYIIALSFTLKSFHPVPPILFLLGMMLIITGLIIKFKPITLGGIFLTIFTFYLNFNPGINLLLVNIIGVSLGMLVPGIILSLTINPMNKLLFNPIRLKIMSSLINNSECDFNYLKKITESTQGNLSIQLKKLKEEKYINIKKKFTNNYPKTSCSITEKGKIKFEEFFKNLITLKENG